jgi:hypothetical protein
MKTKFYDIKADHDLRKYFVVERNTQKIVASYSYKPKESDRAQAAGRAQIHRLELNRR